MSLNQLVAISHYYGANPDYVIAGGGNTSFKDDATLYIKGSGTSLSDITADGFVRMDRSALRRVWEKSYPQNTAQREAAVLADMMAARLPGQESKRPSVETLLHDILPFAFVVHTHPALVNGLTCSQRGRAAMEELFGTEAVWIPSINPGYVLSKAVKDAMDAYRAAPGRAPAIIFLQNHGVFVGADTVPGIKERYAFIMETIAAKTAEKKPESAAAAAGVPAPEEIAGTLLALAQKQAGGSGSWMVLFRQNAEFAALVQDRSSFEPVSSAFTPDHIVYAGSDPLFVEVRAGESAKNILPGAWKRHIEKTGRPPKIAAVQCLGIFGIGASEKAARLALELFADAAKLAAYTQSFGGPRFMSREQIDFINNWEVEQYRSKISGAA